MDKKQNVFLINKVMFCVANSSYSGCGTLIWIFISNLAAVYCTVSEFNIKTNRTFCSFFNNRAPSPQPGLRNCTWFRGNSCCKQEEIDAIFGTVKPLPGSSPECQRYTNYLMCYVCAPYQNIFYRQEKLTVCEEFCNNWYAACSDAILKGSVIGELYKTGREFCKKRNFQCEPYINGSCFIYDTSLTRRSSLHKSPERLTSSTGRFLRYDTYLEFMVLFTYLYFLFGGFIGFCF